MTEESKQRIPKTERLKERMITRNDMRKFNSQVFTSSIFYNETKIEVRSAQAASHKYIKSRIGTSLTEQFVECLAK